MRFIHKIKEKDFISTPINFTTDDYMGFKITLESNINNNNIGIFFRTKLPYGYDKTKFIFKVGILKNNSICNCYKFEHEFTYNMEEQIGTGTFILKSKVKNYSTSNNIFIAYDIIECNYETNNIKMIQKIYQKVVGQEDNIIQTLKDEKDYTEYLKDELKKYNSMVMGKNDKLKIQYDTLMFRFNELNNDINIRDKQIKSLKETIEVLNIEISELNKEIKYYSPDSSITDYLNIGKKVDNDDDSDDEFDKNIYFKNKKYIVDVLNLDRVELKNFDIYDLKVIQKKIGRLNSIVQEKILEYESCKICFTKDLNCILLPCGHRCCCIDCSQNINNKCPICRKSIIKVQKIF